MFDEYIKNKVNEYLSEGYPLQNYDNVYSDTFSELIDKLIIVHIRYWMLEDEMGVHKDNATRVGLLKVKADNLFKEKRPMLVQALDKMIFKLIKDDITYTPSNNKLYKGTN